MATTVPEEIYHLHLKLDFSNDAPCYMQPGGTGRNCSNIFNKRIASADLYVVAGSENILDMT